MPERLKNLSIGQKIVGLSVVLLSLMLAAAVYAFIRTRTVRMEANDVAATLVPLSNHATMIESRTLEQALVLERSLRHQGLRVTSPELGQRELARFRELGEDVEARIKSAGKMVQTSVAVATDVQIAAELGRMERELAALDRDHARYYETCMALLQSIGTVKDEERLRYLDEAVSSAEAHLSESVERLTTDIDLATERQASRMKRAEDSAYLVSAENLVLAAVAFLAGAMLSLVITRRLVRPVHSLISGAQAVGRGNLDVQIRVESSDEIGRLAVAFQNMIVELRSKARIKETFGKYMDPRVVERLLEGEQSSLNTGEKRVMTVYFSDLQGFSTISESLTPAALVKLINSYLALASDPIVRNQGVIDKYIGDAIMAFWGPPFTEDGGHARRACLAALAQSEQLVELRRLLPDLLGLRKNVPTVRARIGLCTGELIVGSIGSNYSKSFTVMGDTVNIASRLEGANKTFGTWILMDEQTMAMVKDEMEAREIDQIVPLGKGDPVRVFELLGVRGEVAAETLRLRDEFEAALKAYRIRDWEGADRYLAAAIEISASDGPANLFRERVRRFRANPPPAEWDGVFRLTEK